MGWITTQDLAPARPRVDPSVALRLLCSFGLPVVRSLRKSRFVVSLRIWQHPPKDLLSARDEQAPQPESSPMALSAG